MNFPKFNCIIKWNDKMLDVTLYKRWWNVIICMSIEGEGLRPVILHMKEEWNAIRMLNKARRSRVTPSHSLSINHLGPHNPCVDPRAIFIHSVNAGKSALVWYCQKSMFLFFILYCLWGSGVIMPLVCILSHWKAVTSF